MKIMKSRVTLDLTSEEMEIIEKMMDLVDQFYINNQFCEKYECDMCPFQAFCYDEVEDILDNIESFLNYEE